LGGIYKLTALQSATGAWTYKVKLSEQAVKVTTPGVLQVRRFYRENAAPEGEAMADMIYDLNVPMPEHPVIVDPLDFSRQKKVSGQVRHEDLLVPVFRGGACVYEEPPLAAMRARTEAQLSTFHAGVKRFVNPHAYPVGLERGLHEMKTRLILEARGVETSGQSAVGSGQ
jgi:nicotinate phosphoribosyltransferase